MIHVKSIIDLLNHAIYLLEKENYQNYHKSKHNHMVLYHNKPPIQTTKPKQTNSLSLSVKKNNKNPSITTNLKPSNVSEVSRVPNNLTPHQKWEKI